MDKLLNSSWRSSLSLSALFTGEEVDRETHISALCRLSERDLQLQLHPGFRPHVQKQLAEYKQKISAVRDVHLITSDFGMECFPHLVGITDPKLRAVMRFRCRCFRVMMNLSQRLYLKYNETFDTCFLPVETRGSTQQIMSNALTVNKPLELKLLQDRVILMNVGHFITLLKHGLRENVFLSNCASRMVVQIIFQMMGAGPEIHSAVGLSLLTYLLNASFTNKRLLFPSELPYAKELVSSAPSYLVLSTAVSKAKEEEEAEEKKVVGKRRKL